MSDAAGKSAKLSYSDINVGDVHFFNRKISKQDVMDFAKLSGDFNPLHVDSDFGKKSQFGSNVVHGMLAASLFSALVGMRCPGEKSLYLSQTLKFRQPIYYEDIVLIRGTVTGKNDGVRMITIKTEILKEGKILID